MGNLKITRHPGSKRKPITYEMWLDERANLTHLLMRLAFYKNAHKNGITHVSHPNSFSGNVDVKERLKTIPKEIACMRSYVLHKDGKKYKLTPFKI